MEIQFTVEATASAEVIRAGQTEPERDDESEE